MNLKEIRQIINLMNENDLCEVEIEREGSKIKIKKSSGEFSGALQRMPIEYRVESHAPQEVAKETSSQNADNRKEIQSPMVGTFYRAPSPEAPSFVDVGEIVEIGQVVCIVEAMKLMNEIKAEFKGKVVEVAVENAQPVEFGQTLFVIEPM